MQKLLASRTKADFSEKSTHLSNLLSALIKIGKVFSDKVLYRSKHT